MVERGRGGDARVIDKILELLDIKEDAISARSRIPPPAARPTWKPPRDQLALPLDIRTWQRPSETGDALVSIALPQNRLLLAFLDVAGHGPRAHPIALYLQGWLRGWGRGLSGVPALDQLAHDLEGELERIGESAAWFLALLHVADRGRHWVSYQALSQSVPLPLLIAGAPAATMESAEAWTLEADPGGTPPLWHRELPRPWTLVIASDGLLRRLGAGDESKGKRQLYRWQTGNRRAASLDARLSTTDPVADDESLMVVRYKGWDQTLGFPIEDAEQRHRARRLIRAEAARALSGKMSERIDAALGEALENVLIHAYIDRRGPVEIRLRCSSGEATVEVEDQGAGGIKNPRHLKLLSLLASHVDAWSGAERGSVVSLTFKTPRES